MGWMFQFMFFQIGFEDLNFWFNEHLKSIY